MKNVIKGLILALVFSYPIAIVAPAVHAETTATTKTVRVTTKANTTKTHHKAAISDSNTKMKSSKNTHKKHLKRHKYTSANLTKNSTTTNKTHK